ncbi:MAG: hypothetical protein ABEI07_00220 [Candidatus Nanohaloarchaea archaeon]
MVDYEDVVSGTIDEVKEQVDEKDLDMKKLLEAEKSNKDRVTLVEWIQERMEEGDGSQDETGEQGNGSSGGFLDAVTDRLFASGFIVGAVIVAVAMFYAGPSMSQGMSPSEAGNHLETYFSENTGNMSLESVTVQRVERLPGSDLYRAYLTLEATLMNRTVTQNQTAVVTSNGRYLFFSQPIDTSKPLSGQVRTR